MSDSRPSCSGVLRPFVDYLYIFGHLFKSPIAIKQSQDDFADSPASEEGQLSLSHSALVIPSKESCLVAGCRIAS